MKDSRIVLWMLAGFTFNAAGIVGSFAAMTPWVFAASLLVTALVCMVAAIEEEPQRD